VRLGPAGRSLKGSKNDHSASRLGLRVRLFCPEFSGISEQKNEPKRLRVSGVDRLHADAKQQLHEENGLTGTGRSIRPCGGKRKCKQVLAPVLRPEKQGRVNR
jgi:hypothetical protein